MLRRSVMAVFALALGVTAVVAATRLGGARADDLVGNWLHNVLMIAAALLVTARAVRVRAERAAWACFAIALGAYAAGEITWNFAYADAESPPYPSLADALWLAYYPAAYSGIVLLVRARVREFHPSLWLDGVVGGLVAASLGATLVVDSVLRATEGSVAAVATTVAYPLGDLVLLGLVVGGFALTSWRPGRAWLLIGAGLGINGIADILYSYQSAKGTWVDGSLADGLFPLAVLLVAWAAWQPAGARDAHLGGWRMFAAPAVSMLAAIGLFGYGLFAGVNRVAATLLVLTGLAVLGRFAVTFRENHLMLRRSRHEALTDALTGLSNRRALVRDLDVAAAEATHEDPRALVLFDLDGFKRYNDTFGHPAGDALLARLGGRLADAVRGHATAYRLGGDEFCVLAQAGGRRLSALIAAAVNALTEHGEGFTVSSSHGRVLLPDEASDPRDALGLADQRMYGQKDGRPSGAGRQTRDVLLGVLRERQPDLHEHLRDVARLARAVGRRLGMDADGLDELTRAAELHDIGKMAIPDAVLDKPGPLDEDEWGFMRRHTVIGERILGAAEALRPVARIVRASHERWDGKGYPDGLAGEEIPLGARVVFACDALDAMVCERPYAPALPEAEALAELRSCAGAQFDPRVVEALCEVLAEGDEELTRRAPAPASPPSDGQPVSGAAARSVASKSVRGIGPTQGEPAPASR